ncbi:hypothetical protein Tco_0776918 [Tanacetum coccineum]
MIGTRLLLHIKTQDKRALKIKDQSHKRDLNDHPLGGDYLSVQANQEKGEDKDIPIDSQQISITTQPSTSKPQKKQSRRKQKKNTDVPHPSDSTTDVPNEEYVPKYSNDPLLSGEDRMKLTELMNICTKLYERVLDLEHTKTAQAQEITNLEPVESTVTTTVPSQKSKDKGKAIMIKPKKPLKMKDQIELNEELARKIEAEEQEELERI